MINLDKTIFNIDLPSSAPAGGRLLVAEPFLREQYFNHAVILLIDFDDAATSMGLVMNNLTDYNLGDLVEGVPEGLEIPVYCGGPVGSDRLLYLHTAGDLFVGSRQIAPGLWVGGDFDDILSYIREDNPVDGVIRFFIGYSGWEAGQLTQEMSQHVWTVTRVKRDMQLLHGDGDSYWHRIVRYLGPAYAGWRFHPSQLIAN